MFQLDLHLKLNLHRLTTKRTFFLSANHRFEKCILRSRRIKTAEKNGFVIHVRNPK